MIIYDVVSTGHSIHYSTEPHAINLSATPMAISKLGTLGPFLYLTLEHTASMKDG